MKPIDQTVFGAGKGNCFAACVAAVLELPIEKVPNFCVDFGEEWFAELEKWLEPFGLAAVSFCFDHGRQVSDPEVLSGFFNGERSFYVRKDVPLILSGLNPDGVAHSVVLDGTTIHDPNPRRRGLASYRDIIALVAIHPHRFEREGA